jgi:hypothetical protein
MNRRGAEGTEKFNRRWTQMNADERRLGFKKELKNSGKEIVRGDIYYYTERGMDILWSALRSVTNPGINPLLSRSQAIRDSSPIEINKLAEGLVVPDLNAPGLVVPFFKRRIP